MIPDFTSTQELVLHAMPLMIVKYTPATLLFPFALIASTGIISLLVNVQCVPLLSDVKMRKVSFVLLMTIPNVLIALTGISSLMVTVSSVPLSSTVLRTSPVPLMTIHNVPSV